MDSLDEIKGWVIKPEINGDSICVKMLHPEMVYREHAKRIAIREVNSIGWIGIRQVIFLHCSGQMELWGEQNFGNRP